GLGDRPTTQRRQFSVLIRMQPTPETTPTPLLGTRHQRWTHRVTFHITQHRQKVVIALYRKRLIDSLVDVPDADSPGELVPSTDMRRSLPVIHRIPRHTPEGDRNDYRGSRARCDRRGRANDWHRRARIHDRHDGEGVPARSKPTSTDLER